MARPPSSIKPIEFEPIDWNSAFSGISKTSGTQDPIDWDAAFADLKAPEPIDFDAVFADIPKKKAVRGGKPMGYVSSQREIDEATLPPEELMRRDQSEYEAETTFGERLRTRVDQGFAQAETGFASLPMNSAVDLLSELESTGDVVLSWRNDMPQYASEVFKGDAWEDFKRRTREDAQNATADFAASTAMRNRYTSSLPQSPARQYAQKTGDWKGGFLADPLGYSADAAVPSAVAMAPALVVAGIARNPVVGAAAMGLTGFTNERAGSMVEYLADRGIDTTSEESIRKALSNREIFDAADKYATTRAAIIAPIDAIGAGLAGRTIAPGVKGLLRREAVNTLVGQPISQAVVGGAGEAAAGLATKGKVSGVDVFDEVLGEVAMSPAETAPYAVDRVINRNADTIGSMSNESLRDVANNSAATRGERMAALMELASRGETPDAKLTGFAQRRKSVQEILASDADPAAKGVEAADAILADAGVAPLGAAPVANTGDDLDTRLDSALAEFDAAQTKGEGNAESGNAVDGNGLGGSAEAVGVAEPNAGVGGGNRRVGELPVLPDATTKVDAQEPVATSSPAAEAVLPEVQAPRSFAERRAGTRSPQQVSQLVAEQQGATGNPQDAGAAPQPLPTLRPTRAVDYNAPESQDLPNFGMPELTRALPDEHPLMQPRDKDASPERVAMRQALIEQRLAGRPSVPEGVRPIAYVMGGGGASGKGTVLKLIEESEGATRDKFVHLDPDSFKTGDEQHGLDGIPEYAELIANGEKRAAGIVHEESSNLYKDALNQAIGKRQNLVLDRTLSDEKKALAELQALKDAGYEIRMVGVTVDPREAIARSVLRAEGKAGRYVPLAALIKAHKGFSLAFENIQKLADRVVLYDNGVAKGESPIPIAERSGDGSLTILDRARYNNFVAKGGINEQATNYRELGYTVAPEADGGDVQARGDAQGDQGARDAGQPDSSPAQEASRGSPVQVDDRPADNARPDPVGRAPDQGEASAAVGEKPASAQEVPQPVAAGESAGKGAALPDSPKVRRGLGVTSKLDAITRAVERFAAGLKSDLKIKVLANLQQVPGYENHEDSPDGAYIDGTVYLFADELPENDVARWSWVFAHEAKGHAGLRGLLGKDLDTALERAARNPFIAELAAAIQKDRDGDGLTKLEATEEALSEVQGAIETNGFEELADRYKVDITPIRVEQAKTTFQKFVETVKALFKAKTNTQFSTSDVLKLLDEATAAVGGKGTAFSKPRQDSAGKLQMDISRKDRVTGSGEISSSEIAALAKDSGASGAELAALVDRARAVKARFPESDGWARVELVGLKTKTEMKDEAIAGEAVVIDGAADIFKWKAIPYGFHLDAKGKNDTSTRGKRVSRMAGLIVDDVRAVVSRSQAGDTNAQAIIRAAGWYAEMRNRLRAEFGGMGDLFADILGATSPKTPVRTNWDFAIDAIKNAMSGNLDGEIDAFANSVVAIEKAEAELADWFLSQPGTKTSIKATDEFKGRVKRVAAMKNAAQARILANVRRIERNAKGGLSQYGTNGYNVMRALVGVWRNMAMGAAPKAVNFSGNLIGYSRRATIDVWAARYLRHLASRAVSPEAFARIPPVAEKGVGGKVLADGTVGAEFGMGQDVMEEASELLRESGMDAFKDTQADDLQAVVWFLEKERWGSNAWTTKTGEGGSFEQEANLAGPMERDRIKKLRAQANASVPKDARGNPAKEAAHAKKVAAAREELAGLESPVDAYVAGLSTSMTVGMQGMDYESSEAEMSDISSVIVSSAMEDPAIIAAKSTTTEGRYGSDIERSFDVELTTRNGFGVKKFFAEIMKIARHFRQDSTFISRRIQPGQGIDAGQHNPGVEVYFQHKLDAKNPEMVEKLERIRQLVIASQGEYAGFTMVTDATPTASVRGGRMPPIVGVRLQYIPEFGVRYGDADGLMSMSSGQRAEHMRAKHDEMARLANSIAGEVDGISYASANWFDTEVRFAHEYDEAIDGAGAADSEVGTGAWSGRQRDQGLQAAARQSEEGGGARGTEPPGQYAGRSRDGVGSRRDATPFSKPRSNAAGYRDVRGRPDGNGAEAQAVGWSERPVQPDAARVEGIHYSNTSGLSALDGKKHGTNHRGSEFKRLDRAEEKRFAPLHKRVFFYLFGSPQARGESVVGRASVYGQTLDNIYDLDQDPRDYKGAFDHIRNDLDWLNEIELKIVKDGFDGLMSNGVIAVLGTKPVPVRDPKFSQPRRDPKEQADADGFDTSKVYYHGTTAPKDFKTFKPGKGGVNELGRGVYVTDQKMYAEAWARGDKGRVLSLWLKKGDIYDLDMHKRKAGLPEAFRDVWIPLAKRIRERPELSSELQRTWDEAPIEEHAERLREIAKAGELNETLERAGYIGAKNEYSQIPGQVVLFAKGSIRSADTGKVMFSQRRTPADAAADNAQKRAFVGNQLGAQNPVTFSYTEQFDGSISGWINETREKVQDKFLSLLLVQGDIEAARGAPLDDVVNVWRNENLMHGRAGHRLETLKADYVDPLIKSMRDAGVSYSLLEDYLEARYAKVRNKIIAARNPSMPDGGSGLKNADADAFLTGQAAGHRSGATIDTAMAANLAALAKRVDAIRANTLQSMVADGLTTQDAVNAMMHDHPNYVPLRGKDGEEIGVGGTGKGLDVRGNLVRTAMGRGDGNRAVNILAEIFGDAERVIVQGEKNRVGQSAALLVLENPNPGVWAMEPVETEQKIDSLGQVYQAVKNSAQDPNAIRVMVKGRPFYIKFKNTRLRDAFKNLGAEQSNVVMDFLGSLNRYASATLTRYNPAFVAVNLTRDGIFGFTGIAAEHGIKVAAQAAKNYGPAAIALTRAQMGKAGSGVMDSYAAEFASVGGKTAFGGINSVEDIAGKIEAEFLSIAEMVARGKTGVALRSRVGNWKAIKIIEGANEIAENTIRLSAYAALRQQGMSASKAAAYAKDLTVNFNRRGSATTVINSLILFFNASVQGAHRTIRLLSNRRVKAAVGAMAGLQFVLAAMAMGLDDEDEDGLTSYEKIPDWEKERNILIPVTEKVDGRIRIRYAKIPMPYGFNVFSHLGGRAAELMMGNKYEVSDFINDNANALVNSFSPIKFTEGVGSVLPFYVKMLVDLRANETGLGFGIRKDEPFSKFDKPRAYQGKSDTAEPFVVAAKAMNAIGGGDRLTPPKYLRGLLDWAPEDLRYLTEQISGGTGRFVSRSIGAGQKLFAGVDMAPGDVPILSSFIGEALPESTTSRVYYDRRAVVEKELARLRITAREDGVQAAKDLIEKTPALEGVKLHRFKTGRLTNASGNIEVEQKKGSAFAKYKAAEKLMTSIKDEMEAVRSGNLSFKDRTQRLKELQTQREKAQREFTIASAEWTSSGR